MTVTSINPLVQSDSGAQHASQVVQFKKKCCKKYKKKKGSRCKKCPGRASCSLASAYEQLSGHLAD